MTPYEYGQRAFHEGINAPALDGEFLREHISGCKVGEGIEPLTEWNRGWMDENLAAPVE